MKYSSNLSWLVISCCQDQIYTHEINFKTQTIHNDGALHTLSRFIPVMDPGVRLVAQKPTLRWGFTHMASKGRLQARSQPRPEPTGAVGCTCLRARKPSLLYTIYHIMWGGWGCLGVSWEEACERINGSGHKEWRSISALRHTDTLLYTQVPPFVLDHNWLPSEVTYRGIKKE